MRTKALVMMLMMTATVFGQSKVYMTKEITPESLVKIYKALGVEAQGRVAVKISTGEGGNKPLIQRINRQHGTYITDYAEKIGLGSKKYELISIDK